jgi:hypothetical protein
VSQLDLLDRRVPSLEMIDGMKQLGAFTKSARDRAQSADVLRMPPAGVVAPAIAVGDESGPHRFRFQARVGFYSTGRRRRSVMRNVEPFLARVDDIGASSSRISNPCSLTTYSLSGPASG